MIEEKLNLLIVSNVCEICIKNIKNREGGREVPIVNLGSLDIQSFDKT